MTQRERQILQWIEENPMISQQELADRAGITRSSVAVHISNLMKKGYIAGKGYMCCATPPTPPWWAPLTSTSAVGPSESWWLRIPIPARCASAWAAWAGTSPTT